LVKHPQRVRKGLIVYGTEGVVVVVFFSSLSSVSAQLQPPYFIDDFEDGSATDDDPVSWVLTPPFDKGTIEVLDGDLLITPSNEGTPIPGVPNWTEIDVSPEGLEYDQVSIRTQVRSLRSADNNVGLFARNTDETSLWAYIQPNGRMVLSTYDGTHNEQWTYNSQFNTASNDIHLRFDITNDQAMFSAWYDGQDPPEHPQLIAYIPDYISETGRVGLWNGEIRSGTTRTSLAVRYFEALPIPEPTGFTLCVFALLGLFGYARRMSK
jgi:hypothetical protein